MKKKYTKSKSGKQIIRMRINKVEREWMSKEKCKIRKNILEKEKKIIRETERLRERMREREREKER